MTKTTFIKVSVNIRATDNRRGWHLYLEAYPIIEYGKKCRKRIHINRVITTPIWDKTRPTRTNGVVTSYLPKRDKYGVIMCESSIDNESCRFAEQLRQQLQSQFDRVALMTPEERDLARLKDISDCDFIEYMSRQITVRHSNNSESIRVNWRRVVELLKMFTRQKPLPLKDIDVKLLERLKNFILSAPRGGGKEGTISRNTASTYFAIVRAGLRQCFVDGYMPVNVADKVKGIPEADSNREYLTIDELNKLAYTPCESLVLKRAALFSALTGARHSDIMKLRWSEIVDEGEVSRWVFKQKKTKQSVNMPISSDARSLCGERGDDDMLVFDGLTPPSWISRHLAKWIQSAGIKKHITFHCFRHTYATLQLQNGTDIYTVSRMLGHTNVRTTECYAKIVDPLKIKATNAIKLDNLKV